MLINSNNFFNELLRLTGDILRNNNLNPALQVDCDVAVERAIYTFNKLLNEVNVKDV